MFEFRQARRISRESSLVTFLNCILPNPFQLINHKSIWSSVTWFRVCQIYRQNDVLEVASVSQGRIFENIWEILSLLSRKPPEINF
jgi:hypothetical protein